MAINPTLYRVAQGNSGTFGVLVWGNIPVAMTLEDNWQNNEHNISCIPAGKYKCVPHNGSKFKGVWRLENVPGREAILIHSGNSTADTEGCILVGSGFQDFGNGRGIGGSVVTLNKLKATLPEKFTLEIIDSFREK